MSHKFTQALQLLQAGHLQEGRQLLRKLAQSELANPHVYDLLGQAERAMGAFAEAVKAHQRAVMLAPQEPAFLERLAQACMYSNEGRFMRPAADAFLKLLALYPQVHGAENWAVNAQTILLRSGDTSPIHSIIRPYFEAYGMHSPECMRLAGALAIAAYLAGDLHACARDIAMVQSLRQQCFDTQGKPILGDAYFYLIYAQFMGDVLAYRQEHPDQYMAATAHNTLHVIGESHSLTGHGMVIAGHQLRATLLMGAKAYFFGVEKGEGWQYALKNAVQQLPENAPVLFTFGEIDSRPSEGILPEYIGQPNYDLPTEVEGLVRRYIDFLVKVTATHKGPCIVSGVPAPARDKLADVPHGYASAYLDIFRYINRDLQQACTAHGFRFMDVYGHTVDAEGWAKPGMHIDGVHLSPQVLTHMLRPILEA